jgi:hypothetical protein
MVAKKRPDVEGQLGSEPNPDASRIFGTMVDAGAGCYLRARDLPRLIALWPREIADQSSQGSLLILSKLRRALRAEAPTRACRPLELRAQSTPWADDGLQGRARTEAPREVPA